LPNHPVGPLVYQSHGERRACGQVAIRAAAARDGETDDGRRTDEHEHQSRADHYPRWGWAIWRRFRSQDAEACEDNQDAGRGGE